MSAMRLSADDKSRIGAAVTAAEARTNVHIAVSIVPASDRYALFPTGLGAVVALFAGGVIALVWPHFPLRQAFGVEVVAFIVVSLLLDWWPLRMRVVPRHIQRQRAQAMAHREFAARILASRERKGGVLLFVSLGERYAEIIADRDAHARVGTGTWDRILSDYTAAAGSGRIIEGILAAIDACVAAIGTDGPHPSTGSG